MCIGILSIQVNIFMELKPEDHVDGKSLLLQVMAWCRQAGDHYLNQCWPSSMTRYGVLGPQSQCVISMKFSGWVRNHTRKKCSSGDGSPTGSTLQLRHNERDGVSNHRRFDCLLNRLFRCRSKKTSKLRVTGLCGGTHRWPVDSSHKGPVTRKMYPFDDVIMRNVSPF